MDASDAELRELPGWSLADAEAPVPAEELTLLRAVPFLAPLPSPTLEHLAGALRPVAAGEAVFAEGKRGGRFYLVAEGLEVSIDGVPVEPRPQVTPSAKSRSFATCRGQRP